MALYVAFEGGEGCGKSTQADRLADRLDAVRTREPGGTDLGARLRSLLLRTDAAPIGPRAEALLMAADRAQHLDELVRPALRSGRHVVSDRTAFSSLAYQGAGRALGVEHVRRINDWAVDGTWPDLVLLLDCPPEVSARRRADEPDRLESEGLAFHERIRAAFLDLAAEDPERWVTIDATRSIDAVAAEVDRAVDARLVAEPT